MEKDFRYYTRYIKTYGKTPQMMALWTILALMIAALTTQFIFAPLLIASSTIIIFIGVGVVLLRNFIRLTTLSTDSTQIMYEFRTLVENLDDGVIVYDPSFTILTFNRAAESIFKISAHEVVGHTLNPSLVKQDALRVLAQTIFPSLAPSLTQISELETWPQIIEITFQSPSLVLHTTLHRIFDEKNKLIGFVKVIRDKTREIAILQSKNEFINITAHQLRTPLTAIHWALQNIMSNATSNTTSLQEITQEALVVSERALKIVNDLLDAAKIEDGRFGYTLETIDLALFFNTIIENITPIANQYDTRVEVSPIQKNIFLIHINTDRMNTAIMNILDNAIKYNTKGGVVTIRVDRVSEKPFVKISIHDTGVGIPENEVQKIFQKLYRGSNVVQLEPNGSGLGLYITKNIIERHGGEIGFESIKNRGTTFWFTLPLDPALIPSQNNATSLL